MKKKVINTHLTLESRKIIEEALNEGKRTTEIARLLKRDRSNIYKEIMKHRKIRYPSAFNKANPCLNAKKCKKVKYECYKTCIDFEANLCEKLASLAHVCNGCTNKSHCHHVKYYYSALDANSEYENVLHTSRQKMQYSSLEINALNTDFCNILKNSRSVFHTVETLNSQGYNFKISTIYRQIKNNKLDIHSNELPRARKKHEKVEKDRTYKKDLEDCTYEDYINFKLANHKANEMQMDTVEGTKEPLAPVILTLQIVEISFIFLFKISSQNAESVINKLVEFRSVLTPPRFAKLFKILLTDNGSEFNPPERFKKRFKTINLFYCHPYSSFEKGSIENNHELIRRVIPKGVPLKLYTQNDYNLLCSHINSLKRKELDGKSPFELVNSYIPTSLLESIGIKYISPKNVNLTPGLLGEKNIKNIKKSLTYSEIKNLNLNI